MNKQIILLISTLIFLSGCITSQPSKFYILTPTKYSADKSNSFVKNIKVGLGPISIAKYLDRSQLVVRLTQNQIRLEDFHQWAGSPRDDIPAIILENISNILSVDTIYKYPWRSNADIDYQVVLEIMQLDGRPDTSVRVVARWEILKSDDLRTIKVGKADFTEPVSEAITESFSGNMFDSFVAAQSRAIGKLSKMIAKSLVELN
ncbi:MAG: membrane integrity-associated transporter subunit PqiC [Desulfamplus sp.]|nr:membrane integrity-associated transporter subunit PqiC [Desulfamplus sp.]